MIDIVYATPPYEITETQSRTVKTYNFIRGLYRFIRGYVIAEPIVICRGKIRDCGKTTILLRGGNLNLRIQREHCRASLMNSCKMYATRGKEIQHIGKRLFKVHGTKEYSKGKKKVILSKLIKTVFI